MADSLDAGQPGNKERQADEVNWRINYKVVRRGETRASGWKSPEEGPKAEDTEASSWLPKVRWLSEVNIPLFVLDNISAQESLYACLACGLFWAGLKACHGCEGDGEIVATCEIPNGCSLTPMVSRDFVLYERRMLSRKVAWDT